MKLWPEFDLILKGDISSPGGLSAFFVLGLFILFIIFAIISIWNFWKANTHLRFYRSLISGLTAEKLLEKRREIVNNALSDTQHGHAVSVHMKDAGQCFWTLPKTMNRTMDMQVYTVIASALDNINTLLHPTTGFTSAASMRNRPSNMPSVSVNQSSLSW